MTTLFEPTRLGDIALANRIVMAPLTRNRALAGNVPGPLTVEYYRQRASAGLIPTCWNPAPANCGKSSRGIPSTPNSPAAAWSAC